MHCNSKRETVKIQHAFSIANVHSDSLTGPVGLATALPPTVCASIRVLLAVLEHYELAFALAGKQVPVAAAAGVRVRVRTHKRDRASAER